MQKGKVKRFSGRKGQGAIETEDGTEYYFHYSGFINEPYRVLTDGMKVEFEIVETSKGIQAYDIRISTLQD